MVILILDEWYDMFLLSQFYWYWMANYARTWCTLWLLCVWSEEDYYYWCCWCWPVKLAFFCTTNHSASLLLNLSLSLSLSLSYIHFFLLLPHNYRDSELKYNCWIPSEQQQLRWERPLSLLLSVVCPLSVPLFTTKIISFLALNKRTKFTNQKRCH